MPPSREILFGRSPILYWIVVTSLLLGAVTFSIPFEFESLSKTGSLLAFDLVALLTALVLWPYHRVPIARRLLASIIGAGIAFLAIESWYPSPRPLRTLLPVAFLALPCLGYACFGSWAFLWRWILRLLQSSAPPSPPVRPSRYVIDFSTTLFDITEEPENDINPIRGSSYLAWLRPQLENAGFVVSGPHTEDWGWYLEADRSDDRYEIGASALGDEERATVDWTVQVRRRRSLSEWIHGRGRIERDDELLSRVERSVDAPGFEDVDVWAT